MQVSCQEIYFSHTRFVTGFFDAPIFRTVASGQINDTRVAVLPSGYLFDARILTPRGAEPSFPAPQWAATTTQQIVVIQHEWPEKRHPRRGKLLTAYARGAPQIQCDGYTETGQTTQSARLGGSRKAVRDSHVMCRDCMRYT